MRFSPADDCLSGAVYCLPVTMVIITIVKETHQMTSAMYLNNMIYHLSPRRITSLFSMINRCQMSLSDISNLPIQLYVVLVLLLPPSSLGLEAGGQEDNNIPVTDFIASNNILLGTFVKLGGSFLGMAGHLGKMLDPS